MRLRRGRKERWEREQVPQQKDSETGVFVYSVLCLTYFFLYLIMLNPIFVLNCFNKNAACCILKVVSKAIYFILFLFGLETKGSTGNAAKSFRELQFKSAVMSLEDIYWWFQVTVKSSTKWWGFGDSSTQVESGTTHTTVNSQWRPKKSYSTALDSFLDLNLTYCPIEPRLRIHSAQVRNRYDYSVLLSF